MTLHHERDLAREYLHLVGKRKLYPALNNYSAFLQGSEYNTQQYYRPWYDDQAHPDLFIHMKKGYSQVWLTEDDVIEAARFGFCEYLQDPVFFQRREAMMRENMLKIDEIYARMTYHFIDTTDWAQLFSLVEDIRESIWGTNAAVWFSIMFDKAFCAGVLQSQHYRVSSDALDSLWERATEPAFESFDKSQLLDIAVQMRAGTSQETIIEHCQYFMTDYHSAKPLVDVEAILKERYADIWDNPEAATAVVARETATQESVMHAHDEWLGTLAEQERMIANYIQLVMRIRDRRKNFFAKGMTIFYRVAERMFREAGIDRDLIPYYTVRELLQGIEYLNVVREELFDRPQGFQWFVPYTGLPQKLNRSIDDGVDLINRAFTDGHTVGAEADLVRGQAGFRGVVRGRVRVVLDMNANHGFQLGEILVTGMTRPEYVPLMRLALAIVTDEGGITCHAAIVSRELKKPCIIGTKIATQVLHDGDLVEVDADAGVVRVIEQATE